MVGILLAYKLFSPTLVYSSKFLKFTILIPKSMIIDEKFNTVTLESMGKNIILSRSATNFRNIEDYVEDLSRKNHFTLSNKDIAKINTYPTISGFTSSGEKDYFIYPSQWIVYTLSTSSPELYDELDQIAKSFKYTGN